MKQIIFNMFGVSILMIAHLSFAQNQPMGNDTGTESNKTNITTLSTDSTNVSDPVREVRFESIQYRHYITIHITEPVKTQNISESTPAANKLNVFALGTLTGIQIMDKTIPITSIETVVHPPNLFFTFESAQIIPVSRIYLIFNDRVVFLDSNWGNAFIKVKKSSEIDFLDPPQRCKFTTRYERIGILDTAIQSQMLDELSAFKASHFAQKIAIRKNQNLWVDFTPDMVEIPLIRNFSPAHALGSPEGEMLIQIDFLVEDQVIASWKKCRLILPQ